MCLSGKGMVDSYVPFLYGICGSQFYAFLVRGRWYAVMCLFGRRFLVGSYVPFR
jgi:hypothetical protein